MQLNIENTENKPETLWYKMASSSLMGHLKFHRIAAVSTLLAFYSALVFEKPANEVLEVENVRLQGSLLKVCI